MSFATTLALLAEEAEHHGNVALETVGFGVIALVVFTSLALVTFSYRNVANRHAHKAKAYAEKHAADLQPSGHGHGH
jgi:heme/copper-type cytochrome/quinol oxidase subunit 2